MKEYALNGISPAALSAAQRSAIYWRTWNAAEAAQPGLNRFAVTKRVIGKVKKITELTDDDFRKLVRAFEHIASGRRRRTDAAGGQAVPRARSRKTAIDEPPRRLKVKRSAESSSEVTPASPAPFCAVVAAGFSAAQLASAIGVTASRIRQRTSCLATDRNGVKQWRIDDLPPEWRESLARRRRVAGFSSDAEWICSRQPWQPQIPLNDLRDDLGIEAQGRRDVFAPVLRNAGDKPISALVREVSERYRARAVGVPNERTLRRWIENAIKRDGGRCEFDRPELYLQGRLTKASESAANRAGDGTFATWRDACHMYSTLVAGGASAASARAEVLRIVRRSTIAAAMSAESARRTLSRSLDKWLQDGELTDRRKGRSGRAPVFVLNDAEMNALRHFRLKKESITEAVRAFAKHRDCRHETREAILAEFDRAAVERRDEHWPLSLRRAAEVTPEQLAMFRSRREYSKVAFNNRRSMYVINEAGERQMMVPNSLWESDDVSINEPFQYTDEETGLASIGRQVLATTDVFSAAFIGVTAIGRPKDAYRVEDIADHMRECVCQHGLPIAWRLERGPWDNNLIDGIPLADGGRWGGLKDIIKIVPAYTPQAKGLTETKFNLLHRVLQHASTSIGRHRGEFERGTKIVARAAKGDPAALLQVWEMADCLDVLDRRMRETNSRPMHRRCFGRKKVVPEELYRAAVKRECCDKELWRFCPVKRLVAVRNSHIETTVTHYPMSFRFRVNGDTDAYLPYGFRVLIAFHPGHPERGCFVFNAEIGARNTKGFAFAEQILVAPLSEDSPQINYSRDEQQFLARKKANAHVAAGFRAIVAAGQRGSSITIRRDGYGNSVVRADGAANEGITRAFGRLEKCDQRSKHGDELISVARAEAEEAKCAADTLKIQKLDADLSARGEFIINPEWQDSRSRYST